LRRPSGHHRALPEQRRLAVHRQRRRSGGRWQAWRRRQSRRSGQAGVQPDLLRLVPEQQQQLRRGHAAAAEPAAAEPVEERLPNGGGHPLTAPLLHSPVIMTRTTLTVLLLLTVAAPSPGQSLALVTDVDWPTFRTHCL